MNARLHAMNPFAHISTNKITALIAIRLSAIDALIPQGIAQPALRTTFSQALSTATITQDIHALPHAAAINSQIVS